MSPDNLQIGRVRANLHLIAPSDLAMVADIRTGKNRGIGQRRENPAPGRGGHVDDALEAVGKHDGKAGIRQWRDAQGTVHIMQISAACPAVKQGGLGGELFRRTDKAVPMSVNRGPPRGRSYSALAASGCALDVMSSGTKSFCRSMTRAPGWSKSMAFRSTIWICSPL